jgi:hypothetical protein
MLVGDAGIVEHHVDTTESLESGFYDRRGASFFSYGRHAGHSLATMARDLFDNLMGWTSKGATSIQFRAHVCNHNLRASGSQEQGVASPQTATTTCHNRHPTIKTQFAHDSSPFEYGGVADIEQPGRTYQSPSSAGNARFGDSKLRSRILSVIYSHQ